MMLAEESVLARRIWTTRIQVSKDSMGKREEEEMRSHTGYWTFKAERNVTKSVYLRKTLTIVPFY
jgi:hypothetical protein